MFNSSEMKPSVVYLVPDALGGIASLISNLIKYQAKEELQQHVILTRGKYVNLTPFHGELGANSQIRFKHSLPAENLYAVLGRLRDAIPRGPGALVVTDQLDLSLPYVHECGRTVYLIVHDEYYLELAKRHECVVDIFISHTKYYFEKLLEALPDRQGSIFYLPYGVPLSPSVRRPKDGPLRLMFLGRMTAAKGIFDLPQIDRLLLEAGVSAGWTVVGDGPEKHLLQEQWHPRHVSYHAPETNSEVLNLCAQNDVLVFPTRFEGFPVAMLECMSAGLVPVVTDLPSGVPEVVSPESGFRVAAGDNAGFAAAIIELDRNRAKLEEMSRECRRIVEGGFDIRDRVRSYQELFARHAEFKRTRANLPKLPYGSRLDKPWMPNPVVRALRTSIRSLRAYAA